MQSFTVLRRLLSFAEATKALPALLAGTLAVLAAVGLIGTAAWIIASAALRPPVCGGARARPHDGSVQAGSRPQG